MLLEGLLLGAVTLGIVRNLILTWRNISIFPDSVPWIGRREESLSRVRVCVRQVFAGLDALKDGYEKYGKKGQCFVLPDAGLRPQLMVAPEQIRWFSELPAAVAAAHLPLRETVGMPYLLPTMQPKHDMYIMDVVRKELTHSLGRLQPDIIGDLKGGVESHFGLDHENWRDIPLYDTMQEILFKSSNRVFVGLPLCQNDIFLRLTATFANLIGLGAVIVGELLPLVLKPVFGYLLAFPVYIIQALAFRYLVPEIKQRMVQIRRKASDPSFEWQEPNDMLTWIVIAAMKRGDPNADRPEKIAQGLLFLMLGGIHTSILTTVNVLLDLLSSPSELAYYDCLREEADSVFAKPEDWENQASLAKLIHTDSAIRESLRRNPVLAKTGLREIIKKDGLSMPDGQKLPKGAWLAIPTWRVHYDERFYPRPELYEPFRFVPHSDEDRAEDEVATATENSAEVDSVLAKRRKFPSLSTATETYLPFGYGRHSCPGRWFVALQLKLLLAYIVSHYDFEPLEHRPQSRTFGAHILPRPVTVKVRRRKGY